jgi:hypothetical protein
VILFFPNEDQNIPVQCEVGKELMFNWFEWCARVWFMKNNQPFENYSYTLNEFKK